MIVSSLFIKISVSYCTITDCNMYIKRAIAVGNPKKPSLGDPHAQQIDSVVTATRLFILHFSAQFKKVPLKPLKVKVD